MFYNHVIKTFPDGTVQHTVFQNPRQRDCEKDKTAGQKNKGDGSSVKRKEIDNNKRAKQKVFDLARSNKFDWFITLTLDPKVCDRFDYDSCRNELSKFTKYLTAHGLQYIIVPEQHEKGGYHFHGLVQGDLPLVPALNVNTQEVIDGLFWVKDYTSGYTTATKIIDDSRVSTYITKYLTKGLQVPKGKKRYWASQGLNKPIKEYQTEFLSDYQLWWLVATSDYQKTLTCEYGDVQLIEFHGCKE